MTTTLQNTAQEKTGYDALARCLCDGLAEEGLLPIDWKEARGFAEARCRQQAAGVIFSEKGKPTMRSPLAQWITAGTTRIGRNEMTADTRTEREMHRIVPTVPSKSWTTDVVPYDEHTLIADEPGVGYIDGSPLQDAVQDAMVAAWIRHAEAKRAQEPMPSTDETWRRAANSARWHIVAWDKAAGRYIGRATRAQRSGDSAGPKTDPATWSIEDHQEEVARKAAEPLHDVHTLTQEEVLAAIMHLPIVDRRTCIEAMAYVETTGEPVQTRKGFAVVNEKRVSRAMDRIRALIVEGADVFRRPECARYGDLGTLTSRGTFATFES
jgi:hypothetical protein